MLLIVNRVKEIHRRSVGTMSADLVIPIPHGSAIQEVRTLQYGVFSIFLFNSQHSLLQVLFLFLFFYIGK